MRNSIILKRRPAGQTAIEYSVLIMVIIGALIASQVYLKRGIQGRWKAAADEMTQEFYDPRYVDSTMTYETAANSVVTIWTEHEADGSLTTMRQDETTASDSRHGTTVIGGY